MIDVRELRIGNFFKISVCDNFRVDEIYKKEDRFYYVKNNIGYNESYLYGVVEDLQPIPITEEMLLKCGFRLCIKEDLLYAFEPGIFRIFDFYIRRIDNKFYLYHIGNDDYSNGVIRDIPLLYLHQLQNIYYDFTGKELNIKWNG